jgi:NTE family protein
MTKKFKDKSSGNSSKKDNEMTNAIQTFAEGSTVVIDALDFIQDMDIDTIKSFSWKQKITNNSMIITDMIDERTRNLSFTAPYIEGNEINSILKFELETIDNKNMKVIHDASVVVKRVHRAIIFQGGASLGAYEAGVFQALVEKLSEDSERGLINGKRPLFDIIAGTSIGALNGAVVVSDFIKSKNWKDSSKELLKFWRNQEYVFPTLAEVLDKSPIYHYWWDIINSTNKAFKLSAGNLIESYSNTLKDLYLKMSPDFKKWYDVFSANYFLLNPDFWKDYFINGWYIPASGEAARKYYSAKQFQNSGAPNVASGILPWSILGKFFDFSDKLNSFPRPDNKHLPGFSLKKTLQNYADFPIKTQYPQPRFLLVTVDLETGDAVTFDSYEKRDYVQDFDDNVLNNETGNKKTKYYSDYGSSDQNKHVIFYEKGVEIEHVLASGTFPNFFDYPKFTVQDYEMSETKMNELKMERHNFWDGGFRSNTPLREVIQAHRDYWHKKDTDEDDVPDLEVYIANLWPSELKDNPISFDHDFVEDRKWNIIFSDKTHYDEKVAEVVSDFVYMTKALRNLAERKGASKDEIDNILKKPAGSKNRKGYTRKFNNLLGGRFRLTKVIRIDHIDDGNEVANKIYDYSYTTIEKLIKLGYQDTLKQMGIQSMEDEIVKIASKKATEKENKYVHELEEGLQRIQRSIITDKGNQATLQETDDFRDRVTAMKVPEKVAERDMQQKEDKTSLIESALKFQEIIKKTKKP